MIKIKIKSIDLAFQDALNTLANNRKLGVVFAWKIMNVVSDLKDNIYPKIDTMKKNITCKYGTWNDFDGKGTIDIQSLTSEQKLAFIADNNELDNLEIQLVLEEKIILPKGFDSISGMDLYALRDILEVHPDDKELKIKNNDN